MTDQTTTEAGHRAGLAAAGEAITTTRASLVQQMSTAREAARTAHTAGIPLATIARDLGISRPTIYTWINQQEDTTT